MKRLIKVKELSSNKEALSNQYLGQNLIVDDDGFLSSTYSYKLPNGGTIFIAKKLCSVCSCYLLFFKNNDNNCQIDTDIKLYDERLIINGKICEKIINVDLKTLYNESLKDFETFRKVYDIYPNDWEWIKNNIN